MVSTLLKLEPPCLLLPQAPTRLLPLSSCRSGKCMHTLVGVAAICLRGSNLQPTCAAHDTAQGSMRTIHKQHVPTADALLVQNASKAAAPAAALPPSAQARRTPATEAAPADEEEMTVVMEPAHLSEHMLAEQPQVQPHEPGAHAAVRKSQRRMSPGHTRDTLGRCDGSLLVFCCPARIACIAAATVVFVSGCTAHTWRV